MSSNISSDIYGLSTYVENIKSKYIDIEETTQSMGIYGYLSEVSTSILQNAVVMASEYSNEAIPTKAKFEKNIITHALSLGVDTVATPAVMKLLLCFPEEYLEINMSNNKFIFDKDIKIMIEDFEFHVDYDIAIFKTELPNGSYVYTAQYNIDTVNPISDITNPYMPPVGKVTMNNTAMVNISCIIRQVELTKIYKKILTSNPLETKIINFSFTSQLAGFHVEAVEDAVSYYITPVYDGLYDNNAEYYCNYTYTDASTLRLKFNSESYLPKLNCDITINIYTTQGSIGNFAYNGDFIMTLESDRFTYDRLYVLGKPISDSQYGVDKKSIEELKRVIPKEALSRGSVTNATDLNNYFNSINTDDCQLLFFKKIDNPLERLYYSYVLLKYNNNVIPTNTIDIKLIRNDFDAVKNDNYVFNTGNSIFYTKGQNGLIKSNLSEDDIINYEDIGFLYMNPFTCIINKSPFYVSYYLTVMNLTKFLAFDYINQMSQIQFISNKINWKRELFTDKDTYKLDISLLQNISADLSLVDRDSTNSIIGCSKIKVVALLYNSSGDPYRYAVADFIDFDEENYIYDFQFKLDTDNSYDDQTSRLKLTNVMDLGTTTIAYGYFEKNTTVEILVYVKTDTDYGREGVDAYVPNMDGWTLANKYGIANGIDLFYDYSSIISSNISVKKNADTSLSYFVDKMPVIRQTYINSEERIQAFVKELELRRLYIEDCLSILEDSFGIDFKFFNTYGPSELFNINSDSNIDKVNITLNFKVKFVSITDKYIKEYIINDIKEYIETIEDGITDLHMPNIVTQITNTYREQLVYFEFVEINNYGTSYQHIYRPNDDLIGKIPEFLNINMKNDGTADINLTIIS